MRRCSFVSSAVVAAVAMVSLLAATADAQDIINRKGGGKRVAGKIPDNGITRTKVTINTGLQFNMPNAVDVNEIDFIKWDGQPLQVEIALNSKERRGRYADAIKDYEEVLKTATSKNLKTDLQYYIARASGKLGLADPSKAADAVLKLEQFRTANASTYHYYEIAQLLGDLHLATKQYDKALAEFRKIETAPWKEMTIGAKNSQARVLREQGKTSEALTAYKQLVTEIGSDPKLRSMRDQAILGQAACLLQSQKSDEALKQLNSVISASGTTSNTVLAEAYLLRGDAQYAKGNKKDALLAYLHVDILFPGETRFHPKALYHLSKLWTDAGYQDRADDAKQRLQKDYPGSEWAKKS